MTRANSKINSRANSVRLHLELLEDRTLPSASVFDPTHVLVRFAPGAASGAALGHGMQLGAAFALVPGLHEVRLTGEIGMEHALAALRANPNVLYAEPDYELTVNSLPNDPGFSNLWGMHNTGQGGGRTDADVDAPEAWDISTGNGGVIVAVIDTGVDYDHPDLEANMWVNPGEVAGDGVDNDSNGIIDDVYGANFTTAVASGNPDDDNSHGTHVAGTIGAVGNNGIGVAGVAWNVKIMALKFLGATGSGSTSNAIRALNYAVNMGAEISNNSWGGGSYSQSLYDAIASAKNAGHIFVAAAGNSGTDNDTTASYPANYNLDNVVSVAATDRYDLLASFSNYGDSSVDLAAPGVSIYSTLPGGTYGTKSGTSMAAPHVTGALALVLEQNPTWTYRQVIDRVLDTVDPLTSLSGKTITGGRLNVANALDSSAAPAPPALPSLSINSVSRAEGATGTTDFTFTVSLSGSSTQTVTVDWATASGSATGGVDYLAANGTVEFAPGETSKSVTVSVNGDTVVESNETFFVNLSSAENATIATAQGTGAIINDDSTSIAINDVSLSEGNSGATAFTFTVSLSAQSTQTVSVNWAAANGSAAAGSDFQSANGAVTFLPGETTKFVTVQVNGDLEFEANETFVVNLSGASNATIADNQGVGTILNDEAPPVPVTITINDVSQTLLRRGTTDFVFTVTLSQATTTSVSVNYATADGTLRAPGGYNAAVGTLIFLAGETQKTITVKVKRGNEGDYFFVNLSSPSNGSLSGSQGVGTVSSTSASSIAGATSLDESLINAIADYLDASRTGNRKKP